MVRQIVVASSASLFIGITAVSLVMLHQFCDADDRVSGMLNAYRTGQGFEGVDEYAPPRADNTLPVIGVPDACLSTDATTVLAAAAEDGAVPEWDPANGHCDATYSWTRQNGTVPIEHRRVTAEIPHAGFLILHLRNYAAWKVHVNGKLLAFGADSMLPPLPYRQDGMMAIPTPAGRVDVAIDWTTTRDVIAGRWLSAISLVFLIALCVAERRSFRKVSSARGPRA